MTLNLMFLGDGCHHVSRVCVTMIIITDCGRFEMLWIAGEYIT